MRTRIFSITLIFCLVFLISGLAYTQIGRYQNYKIMSEENRLKVVPLMARRGTIFDRKGEVLVKDILSFNVAIIYSRIRDKKALIDELSSILDTDREEVGSNVEKGRFQPYRFTTVAEDIGMEKAIHIMQYHLH